MKLTKTLSAAIAATTIAGALGFAVAQTTDTTTPATTTPNSAGRTAVLVPNAAAPATNVPATPSTTPAASDMTTSTEPAAKPDRN